MNNQHEKVKVFFIDLDGTLLDEKVGKRHFISQENISEIKAVMQSGRKIVVSTGRMGVRAKEFGSLLDVDYLVVGNGAQVINREGQVIYDKSLSAKQSLKIIEFCKLNELLFSLDGKGRVYGVRKFIHKMIVKRMGYFAINNYHLEMNKVHQKFVLFGHLRSKMKIIAEQIKHDIPELEVAVSRNYIEITHRDATKGKANEFVWKELYKIKDQSQTAHIGDSMNDASVIGHVGRLIGMKNSSNDLYQIITHIGPHYKNGGVAKVLRGEYRKKT